MNKSILALLLPLSILASAQQTKKKGKKKTLTKTVQKAVPITKDTTALAVPSNIKTNQIITPAPEPVKVDDSYLNSVKKLEKTRGWISNRNSYGNRGIWGFVKGVYSGQEKIYIVLQIENKTNINYDVESITFITKPRAKDGNNITADEKNYTPIWQTEFSKLEKKASKKLIFVFDKFTIAESKILVASISELDGERTLDLIIKPEYINGAEYIK